jgi:hypothetical protein
MLKEYLFPKHFTKENKIGRVVGLIVFNVGFTTIIYQAEFGLPVSIMISLVMVLVLDFFAGIGRTSPFEDLFK